MAARRVRQNFPQRARRQPSSWSRVIPQQTSLVAAATKVLVNIIVLSNPGIGETVRRTRGLIMVKSDQSAAEEQQFGAVGFVVVNDLAIAAGAAAIPGPFSEQDDDGWYVWQPLFSSFESGETSAQFYPFDSKAMRRVEEGFSVAVMVENASATTGLEVAIAISSLSSLS